MITCRPALFSRIDRSALGGWVLLCMGLALLAPSARAGDPGYLPMRRLSNAEYDYTIRDLTGVDLQPAREFPADGAAGEGFSNAAEALSDISPTLLNKYLLAAKEMAAHAVLLPDGFRFSMGKTRRDWSDESLAQLRTFYARFTPDGRLPLQAYLAATIRHREALAADPGKLDEIAAKENLNPRYFRILYQTLSDRKASFPLDAIRAHWRAASEKETGALAAEIAIWQGQVWRVVPIGSYRDGNLSRQKPIDTAIAESQTIRLAVKPAPGQNDVVLYLSTREVFPTDKRASVIWSNPRFEALKKPPRLLRDYPKFGAAYEIDYAAAFADAGKYLAGVLVARDAKRSIDDVAKDANLDVVRLKRWIELVGMEKPRGESAPLKIVPAVPLELLAEKVTKNDQRPGINGWRGKGADLPVFLSNASDTEEHIPGRASPHKIVVHPMPGEFVAAVWKSPIEGVIRISGNVAHAHPNCGNGVAWWVEHRRGDGRAGVLAEGAVELGGAANVPAKTVKVAAGDLIVFAIDAKNGDHSCDLTEISLTISEVEKAGRSWDLAGDIADHILDGNPHADRLGNKEVWSFVKGASRPTDLAAAAVIPATSILARWRDAAGDPARLGETTKLGDAVQGLLVGARPAKEKDPDRILYDMLVSPESPVLLGVDLSALPKRQGGVRYGLEAARFGIDSITEKSIDPVSVAAAGNSVIEVRLPAALFRDREFVVEGKLGAPDPGRAAQFEVGTTRPDAGARWDGKSGAVAMSNGAAQQQLRGGLEEFRRCFPMFICFPGVIPVDEVVCLKMYHREDEPLIRLFLDDAQHRAIDRLWEQHRFITQQPVAENRYLPLFIGFVTQDQTKEMLAYYEGQREPFRKRAEQFESEVEGAAPVQVRALIDFTSRAYRRPLQDREKVELAGLYQALRGKGMKIEDAFRGVLSRVLVAPSFLFKMERPPGGKKAGAVNDWELATRLSYFLWSSVPDEELCRVAAAGRLHDPAVLAQQVERMLKDRRVRALAIEFGTQWIHVRGFDGFKEKSEKLYPAFDDKLRAAIYEESILFFQDLFQNDQPIDRLLNADYTYLNDTLARHYGIPNVSGSKWRKVDGVQKFGRGGILGLASVQAKQAGAARTSPVLRGNWVMETLLGEKLPRPPPDVPRLPEEEGADGRLTMRQLVEKHMRMESCAVCHRRIDPLGFSFERYDAIGRLREKENTGLAIDCRAKLKDGTEFEGLDGLRRYLLTTKHDTIARLFCRRLLGYALGRAVNLSDQKLLDEMMMSLNKNQGRLSTAVQAIIQSPQFQQIRGASFTEDE